MSTQRVLTTVSLPPSLFKEARELAEKEGRTTSEVFRESLRQYLWFNRWERVRKYGLFRASSLGLKPDAVDSIIHEFRKERKTKGRR